MRGANEKELERFPKAGWWWPAWVASRHEVGGIYREVVPNSRLQFTWAWHSTPERQSLVTVTVAQDGEGTLLTLNHEQFFDEKARDDHQRGWTGTLEKLARYLS